MKVYRANQTADKCCIDALQSINYTMGAFSQAVEQYARMAGAKKRADFDLNQFQRDRYIRFNDFKKNMVERESMTVSNYLMQHSMEAVETDQHSALRKCLKRKSPEEDEEEDTKLQEEFDLKKKQEMQLKEMQLNSTLATQEATQKQLETELRMLQSTIESLQKELNGQKAFSLQVAQQTISTERSKRARLQKV